MSQLKVSKLSGISSSLGQVTVPAGHELKVDGKLNLNRTDGFQLPSGTTAQRPASPPTGAWRFNTTDSVYEIYNGTDWVANELAASGAGGGSGPLGTSEEDAADSAKQIFENGVTSGKGYRWIKTPNGGTKQVWCDFDTQDQDGNSGWMLVATFEVDYDWTYGQLTTRDVVGPVASSNTNNRTISANFGDSPCEMFRMTIAVDVNRSLGTDAPADWYFYNNEIPAWKEWWAYGSSVSNLYAGGDIIPKMRRQDGNVHDRMILRPFTHAYNITKSYEVAQTHMSLCDATYSGSGGPPTSGATSAGSTNASSLYWTALTTDNYFFSVYYQQYANGDITRDGSIGILPQGTWTTTSAAGQDLANANVHTGYDDNNYGTYIGSTATADMNATNYNSQQSSGAFYWWIK